MKKKKILCTILIAVIVVAGIGLIWYNSSVDMLNLDVEKVATIKIQNGNTGEMLEITNQEDISYLIEQWNNTELSCQKLSFGYVGYSLCITILDGNGNKLSGMNDFYINSDEVMRKDPFFYDLGSGNLNHNYIQELFEENAE